MIEFADLIEHIGAKRINQDAAVCSLHSEDIAGPSEKTIQALITPRDTEMVAFIVQWAMQSNVAVIARGGGMSYTGGYLPTRDASIMLDMTALNRTIQIDRATNSVMVDVGCTWSMLYNELAKENLRTPFFGPLSGYVATVGGAVSQNAAFFGSARYGTVREHVLGIELVDGCGRANWIDHSTNAEIPSVEYTGSELLTALIGDGGTLGIKTRVKLATIPTPVDTQFASFVFDHAYQVIAAMGSLRSVVQLADVYAFDRQTHLNLARNGFSLQDAPEFAKDLVAQSQSVVKSAVSMIKGAALSKLSLKESAWSLHVVLDLGAQDQLQPLMQEVNAICMHNGASAIPDTIPRITRARPFRPIKALIGPDGERWLPCHGVFKTQQATLVMQKLEQWLADNNSIMRSYNIRISMLMTRVGQQILIEPQFFWPDALSNFQRTYATESQAQKYQLNTAKPKAREQVHKYRAQLRDLFVSEGAGFMQLGKYYPNAHGFNAGSLDTAQQIKMQLDPQGIINPGACVAVYKHSKD